MSRSGVFESSITDMVTSLMIIFILLLINFLHDEQGKGQDVLDEVESLKQKLAFKLEAVNGPFSSVRVERDPKDPLSLVVIIPEKERTLFVFGDDNPTEEFGRFLDNFSPVLGEVLLSEDVKGTIRSVIIEGHTDRVPFKKDARLGNVGLSQKRALQVLRRVLEAVAETGAVRGLQSFISASGRGDEECSVEEKAVDSERASCRKVVFKIRVKSVQEREFIQRA